MKEVTALSRKGLATQDVRSLGLLELLKLVPDRFPWRLPVCVPVGVVCCRAAGTAVAAALPKSLMTRAEASANCIIGHLTIAL